MCRAIPALVVVGMLLLGSQLRAAPSLQLPGAPPFDAELQTRLRAAAQTLGAEHRSDGAPAYVNRLALSTSPYLQQHAFNPVNWYPWGPEAFAAARRADKPIFLSIGYATCHWCHVMARECFENDTLARQLNEHFIAIKVDREERPDIDEVYVAAVTRMTGGAGWPLSVFLTPDGRPFYGGTYFPPQDLDGHPGFGRLLTTLAEAWKSKRNDVLQASAALTAELTASRSPSASVNLTADTLHTAFVQMRQAFDPANGGFGRAPKFPQPHMLTFLLRYADRTREAEPRQMVETTLDHMARGGIYDQLGDGFHRYATDPQWRVPHFEKMLYDQAMTARAYLEAAQATGAPPDAEVARGVFRYVLRDLTAPGGGFYAAEDADSDGDEGRFYTWSRAEIVAAVGAPHGALVADFFGISDAAGRHPLSRPVPLEVFAAQRGIDATTVATWLGEARRQLLAVRDRRQRPARDEQVVTAWNGAMIASLAYGSRVLNEPSYAEAAARAADFVLAHLQRDGRLLRSFHATPSPTPGYLDDYAFFIWGLTELYAATFDARWLREADRLARDMLRLFADPSTGGLRYRADDHEALIAVADDAEDAALPSGQSIAAVVLLRLGRLTMNDTYDRAARAVLAGVAADVARAPTAHAEMLAALDFLLGPTKEIVIAGPADAAATGALLTTAHRRYLPRAVLALHQPDDSAIEALVPFLKTQTMLDGRPAAYVCEHYVCKLPTTDPAKLAALLDGAPGPVPQGR